MVSKAACWPHPGKRVQLASTYAGSAREVCTSAQGASTCEGHTAALVSEVLEKLVLRTGFPESSCSSVQSEGQLASLVSEVE